MVLIPWRAVSANDVAGQECQLNPAAPGVAWHLHRTGGPRNPVGEDGDGHGGWLFRVER